MNTVRHSAVRAKTLAKKYKDGQIPTQTIGLSIEPVQDPGKEIDYEVTYGCNMPVENLPNLPSETSSLEECFKIQEKVAITSLEGKLNAVTSYTPPFLPGNNTLTLHLTLLEDVCAKARIVFGKDMVAKRFETDAILPNGQCLARTVFQREGDLNRKGIITETIISPEKRMFSMITYQMNSRRLVRRVDTEIVSLSRPQHSTVEEPDLPALIERKFRAVVIFQEGGNQEGNSLVGKIMVEVVNPEERLLITTLYRKKSDLVEKITLETFSPEGDLKMKLSFNTHGEPLFFFVDHD